MTDTNKATNLTSHDATAIKLNGVSANRTDTPTLELSKNEMETLSNALFSAIGCGKVPAPRQNCVPFTFVSPKTKEEVGYQRLSCWYNAAWNQTKGYSKLNLEFKVGTCCRHSFDAKGERQVSGWGFTSVGGKDGVAPQNERQWKEHLDAYGICDLHCWLEDKEGNVYDYDFWNNEALEGVPKKTLQKKKGILYAAASGKCLTLITSLNNTQLRRDGILHLQQEGKSYKETMLWLDDQTNLMMTFGGMMLNAKWEKAGMDAKTPEEQEAFVEEVWKSYFLDIKKKPLINHKVVAELKTKTNN